MGSGVRFGSGVRGGVVVASFDWRWLVGGISADVPSPPRGLRTTGGVGKFMLLGGGLLVGVGAAFAGASPSPAHWAQPNVLPMSRL